MLERLETSFAEQRRFTADASHEMRTPLTVIKSAASRILMRENLPDEFRSAMERIGRSANVMERLVQDLLTLARSDAGQPDFRLQPGLLPDLLDRP